jgi:hypothetical protein
VKEADEIFHLKFISTGFGLVKVSTKVVADAWNKKDVLILIF